MFWNLCTRKSLERVVKERAKNKNRRETPSPEQHVAFDFAVLDEIRYEEDGGLDWGNPWWRLVA